MVRLRRHGNSWDAGTDSSQRLAKTNSGNITDSELVVAARAVSS